MDGARRKRINRIKRVILILLALAVVIPLCFCVYLSVELSRTKERLAHTQELLSQAREEAERNGRELAVLSALSGLEKKSAPEPAKKSIPPGGDPRGLEEGDISDFDRNRLTAAYEEGEIDTYDIYLTFDDGPSENTDEILKILREYDVKATFFVNGRTDEDSMMLYKQIALAGHTLGMHSYSHRYNVVYRSDEAFREDLFMIKGLIREAAGVDAVYYRFPGGSSNHVASAEAMHGFIDILHENGVEYIDWNIDSRDSSGGAYSADRIVDNVFKDFGRYKTNVVLLHDGIGHVETVKALPQIIERARNMGARLMPITPEAVSIKHIE